MDPSFLLIKDVLMVSEILKLSTLGFYDGYMFVGFDLPNNLDGVHLGFILRRCPYPDRVGEFITGSHCKMGAYLGTAFNTRQAAAFNQLVI
jgi:hypothetical protein